MEGRPSLQSTTPRWHTIRQERPSEKVWKLWRKANTLWSDTDNRLYHPLGSWIVPLHAQRMQHFAYTHRSTLFIRDLENSYQVLHRTRHNTYRPSTTSQPQTYDSLPEKASPVEVSLAEDLRWRRIGPYSSTIKPKILLPSETATFDLFVSTLDPWKVDLLQHINMHCDPYTLCHELTSGFRASSDGSVQNEHNGAFGWVLSTKQGVQVATGSGPARGRQPRSYRAEAYGLWSILRFLIRVKEYTGMHEQWKGIVYTDGQSVLDTLRTGDPDPDEEPDPIDLVQSQVVLKPLCPEWDVLIEIQSDLKVLPGVGIRYVKGHQDEHKPYHTLPLSGRLNVDADHQAYCYQTEHGASRPFVLMSPRARAHLLFQDGTVTSKYELQLQLEATGKPLYKYIQQKQKWSDGIMSSINWEAHGMALKKRCTAPHTHMVKLLHETLPTTAFANRMDGGQRKCPMCSATCEDRDHILQCPNTSRQQWRDAFMKSLDEFHCAQDTHSLCPRLLNDGITLWLNASTDSALNISTYPPEVHHIIRQQNKVGWRQIFHGRFVKAWSQVQDRHLSRHQPSRSKNLTGEKWQTSLILFVWDKWYTLWKQRNQELYGSDTRTRDQAASRDLRRQLENIYRHRQLYEPHVQQLLYPNATDHDQHPTITTRNWLSTNNQIFTESLRRVRKRALSGVRSLRSYFHPK